MTIRLKIMLFTTVTLLAMVVLVTLLSAYNIRAQGDARIAAYRGEALEQIKNHLTDLVEVAYQTIDSNYQNLSKVEFLSNYYRKRLSDILDSGDAIIKRYKERVARGTISLEEAQFAAKEEIKTLRFDGGTGYIWINDTGQPFPRMVMHPTVPTLDGKILDSRKFNNALGREKNLFQAFVDVTRESPDGYVDYLWPKPTQDGVTDEMVPKLSYVRRHNDWGWILGTGIYIDDAEEDIKQRIITTVKGMRYDNGTGYFWINDNTLPYPTMIMHPTLPELDGTVLDDPKFNNALGVDQNLFQAFAEVTAANDSGFVDYLWPKPTPNGLSERTEKISYVKLHKPTGWIIGSGAYIDNISQTVAVQQSKIEQQVRQLIKRNIMASFVFMMFVVAVAYVLSSSFSKPIQHLTLVAEQISKGKDLDLKIAETSRSDEIGELARSIERLKTSTKIMLNRLKAASKK
ncbi:methyl-accepting chemotaxis protein [Alteromonadaceae bacterium 2753L.S.0a.02]|nr:methyl-accepting chemotaxis protein [Alteromonadaceae bacterium 2753L.S.0a.02]